MPSLSPRRAKLTADSGFLTYMALGGAWLFIVARRRRGILEEIETDLEAAS